MAPEQARGKAVDRRADIWAFGCVLNEMLSGKQTFQGEDATEIPAAVVMKEPALEALPEKTPAAIRNLLHRCLEKALKPHLQHIGDARILIGDTPFSAAADEPAAAQRKGPLGSALFAWAVAAIAVAVPALAWRAFAYFRGASEGGTSRAFIAFPTGDVEPEGGRSP